MGVAFCLLYILFEYMGICNQMTSRSSYSLKVDIVVLRWLKSPRMYEGNG